METSHNWCSFQFCSIGMLTTELLEHSKGKLLLILQAELLTATPKNNVPLISLATIKSSSLKNCFQSLLKR